MTELRAHTTRAAAIPTWRPGDFLFSRPGIRLVGRGVATRIRVDRLATAATAARSLLSTIEHSGDSPIGGPVAIGALAFHADAASELVVPAELHGCASGQSWSTTIAVDGGGLELPPVGTSEPDAFKLSSPVPHEKWCHRVNEALEAIRSERFEKVVLAREVVVETNRDISLADVVRRLEDLYPACTVFAVDGFVGATPELLVQKNGQNVRCHPLAATVPRSGDPEADEAAASYLLESSKERHEHAVVVDAIRDVLDRFCTGVDVSGPHLVSLRNVIHLGTELRGVSDPFVPVLDLVARLHPTPAVAGWPVAPALEWLAECEGLDRGRYAGPVGWTNSRGDGEWVVGIRSAEIEANRARLFAGVGIVEGSTPEAELAETQFKLQALLAALVRP